MIAVMSALEEEMRHWKNGMSVSKNYDHPGWRVYEGKRNNQNCLLVLTGMGKERAEKATNFMLKNFPVRTLISTGFGGALNEKTRAGDVIICSRLNYEDRGNSRQVKSLTCDSVLVSLASHLMHGADFQTLNGNGVTVSEICCTPDDKCRLGRDFSADVVDMESYWIGRIATEQRIPFLAVRSIFDTVKDDMSAVTHFTVDGKIKPFKALSHFVCHPGQWKQTASYSRNFNKAAKNLAMLLDNLVQEI